MTDEERNATPAATGPLWTTQSFIAAFRYCLDMGANVQDAVAATIATTMDQYEAEIARLTAELAAVKAKYEELERNVTYMFDEREAHEFVMAMAGRESEYDEFDDDEFDDDEGDTDEQ